MHKMEETFDRVKGGLELKLFEDLEEHQQRQAAFIFAGLVMPKQEYFKFSRVMTTDMVRANPNQRSEERIDEELRYLNDSLEYNVVITAVDYREKVVAVYEMHPFVRDGDFLRNKEPGFLITEPTGQHIGDNVLKLLLPILESLAYSSQSSYLIHTAWRRKGTLFTRNGYTDEGDLGNTGKHQYMRRYQPREHSLQLSEMRIIEDFQKTIVNAIYIGHK